MTQDLQVRFVVYQGPNPRAPFPAVMAEFQPPPGGPLEGQTIHAVLAALLPMELAALAFVPEGNISFATLAAHLAAGVCDRHGPWDFRQRVLEHPGASSCILLEQIIPAAALEAMKAGLELANLAFQHGGGRPVDPGPCLERVRRHLARWDALHSDPNTLGQMRIARRRGIPVYEVASAPRFRLFGQGAASHLAECTADDRDGYSGCHLASDKSLSNEVVRRLGYPCVEHKTVREAQEAVAVARQFGFPVVIKPRGGDMGHGVTAGITSEPELIQAFRHAVQSHPGPVLVERHVEGDPHRLVALDGRFAWALRYKSARIIGDGVHTVAELLAAENARRAAEPSKPGLRQVQQDGPMVALLQRQGLTLDACAEVGRVVLLRTTSNWITGGTLENVTSSVHPDNRELAEGLARTFRLGATGIDFIAPDIRRSWREGGCAVLEVNPTPGMGSEAQIEALMAARFPGGTQGRIPTVLLLGAPPEAETMLHEAFTGHGLRTGLVTSDSTMLGQEARFPDGGPASDRIRGLFLDPGCEALVVSQEPGEAETLGLPLDHFEVVVLGEPQATLQALAVAAGGTVVPWTGPGTVPQVIEALSLQP